MSELVSGAISKVRDLKFQIKTLQRHNLQHKIATLKNSPSNFTNLEIAATLGISENLVRQLIAESKAVTFVSETTPLEQELASLLNRHSAENESNTPDFILAEYLMSCLNAFNEATNSRTEFHKSGVILDQG